MPTGTIFWSLLYETTFPEFSVISEETYYVVKGKARMIIDDHEFSLSPGQACLIMPGKVHQIFNDEKEDLEFLTVSAPAWTPDDSFDA
ncbi:MAG: cupin domain-containing protein [Chloroflexota bacterium]